MIKVDETDPVGEPEPQFPYRQVSIKRGEDIKQYYELCEEIGRGKFGTVYKCKEKSTGLCMAAKFIAVPNRKERKNVERELDMMNRLQHPKIIQLYDAYEYNKMVCVVLELIDGGELFDRVLDDKFILTEKACSVFMRQICEAMDYIHEHNIIHLDLKPENILCLTESGNRIKIIDFGLAREYDPSTKLQVLFGTPEFVAPEVVNFNEITFATDMWSIGVIAYVLVSGLSPFAGNCDVETMGNVTVGKYDFNDEAFDNISPECIDFITKLLVKEQDDRMNAKQAVRHRWIKKKPQYTPTNSKHSTNSLPFKAVFMDKDNSMTTAKDNLRSCVDRWNESTPYVFDKHTNSISPVHTISSSIATSPSHVASLDSSFENLATSDENEMPVDKDSIMSANLINNSSSSSSLLTSDSQEHPPPSHASIMSLKDYFFRHKSVDNCFLPPPNSIAAKNVDRFYLFDDEIKKLTNHLFEITTNHYSEHNNKNKSLSMTSSKAPTGVPGKIDNDDVKKMSPSDAEGKNNRFSAIFEKFTKLATDNNDTSTSSQVPWAVTKRTKFRLNQTSSRDVPIVRTEKPARLKKQNAIDDASDMKLFDEKINHQKSPHVIKSIVDIFDESFLKQNGMLHSSRFRHETFVSRLPNGSISFDCGQLGVEQRSINTIRALFQLHASTGTSVKNILGQIEAKNKS